MSSELEWVEDKQQFIDEDAEQQNARKEGRAVAAESLHAGAPFGALAREFAQLAKSLFEAETIEGVLKKVITTALDVVPGADLTSVSLSVPAGCYTTAVHTDPMAARLDELQYHNEEGPCVEATRTPGLGVAFSRDLTVDQRWPTFGRGAAELGVHSVLVTGLFPESQSPRLGSLNIYSRQVGGLDDASRTIALLLASHASIALGGTEAVTKLELENAQLHTALQSRDVIGQAKGILMRRHEVDADNAFDLLRRASQDLNIKIASLAEMVVADRRAL